MLTLPGAQPDLLEAVRQSTKPGVPVTVIVMNGGAVAMDYAAVSDGAVEVCSHETRPVFFAVLPSIYGHLLEPPAPTGPLNIGLLPEGAEAGGQQRRHPAVRGHAPTPGLSGVWGRAVARV